MKRKRDLNMLDMIPRLKGTIEFHKTETGGLLKFSRNGRWDSILRWVFPQAPQILTRKLDYEGTRVTKLCDGTRTIQEIGQTMILEFGHKEDEVYARLAQFMSMLYRSGIIELKEKSDLLWQVERRRSQ